MIATPVGELLLDQVDEATTRTIACFVAELREAARPARSARDRLALPHAARVGSPS